MGKTRTVQPEMKTTPTRQATTQSTKKVKTPGPETSGFYLFSEYITFNHNNNKRETF
jgi:hypothetical protein